MSSSSLENILKWFRATFIDTMITGYEIYFTILIWLKIHIRVFGKTTTLTFPFLIQQLSDGTVVSPIPKVDHYIKVKHIVDTNLIKYLTN